MKYFLQDITTLEILAILFASVFLYYVTIVSKRPKIYTGNSRLENFIQRHMPCVNRKFYPSIFLWDGRLQTIYGQTSRVPSKNRLPYIRDILEMTDGGKIALDFLPKESENKNVCVEKMALLMPGLASTSQSSYIKSIALSLAKYANTDVVVINHRGLAGVPLTTPKGNSATNYDDLEVILKYLKLKYPSTSFIWIGTSLGGMIMAQYLLDHPQNCKEYAEAACIISPVFAPWVGTENIERTINLPINYQLADGARKLAVKYREVFEGQPYFDFPRIVAAKTLRQVDALFTAPQFGYDSLEKYYDHATVTYDVGKFTIPVVALNSYDDPLQPGEGLSINDAQNSKNFALVMTSRGGHLGFLEGVLPQWQQVHFMEKFIVQFVTAVVHHSDELSGKR